MGLDTGSTVDVHPAFTRRVFWAPVADIIGHGTHVAGTLLGDFKYLGKAGHRFRGIASKAKLVSIPVNLETLDSRQTTVNLLTQFIPGIGRLCIICCFWGIPATVAGQREYDADVAGAVDTVRFTPLTCILFAAGNQGHVLFQTPVGRPMIEGYAAAKNCMTVGATYSDRPLDMAKFQYNSSGETRSFRECVSFSDSGPTGEGFIKLDVVAPGVAVVSAPSRPILQEYLEKFIHDCGDPGIAYCSSHPALNDRPTFFNRYRRAWGVASNPGPDVPLYIGGFEVHLRPNYSYRPRITTLADGNEPFRFELNLSTIPTDETLAVVRETFPGSIGLRLMLGGYVDIIFESKAQAKVAQSKHDHTTFPTVLMNEASADRITQLDYRFTVQSAREPTIHGDQVGLPDLTHPLTPRNTARGCIGAKIALDGVHYFTTVTHGLVNCKGS